MDGRNSRVPPPATHHHERREEEARTEHDARGGPAQYRGYVGP